MTRRAVELHIDQLIVSGMNRAEARAFQASLETELARALDQRGGRWTAGEHTILHGDPIDLPHNLSARAAGQAVVDHLASRFGG